MDREYWINWWNGTRTGFRREGVNPQLVRNGLDDEPRFKDRRVGRMQEAVYRWSGLP